MSAILQGMIEGIEGGAVPPPPVEGNAYDEEALSLPDDMDEALQLMEKGTFSERALGPLLSKVYRDLKRAEILAFGARSRRWSGRRICDRPPRFRACRTAKWKIGFRQTRREKPLCEPDGVTTEGSS